HSQTVRGTLSNPKLDTTKSSKTPPQLGDPVSLQPETYDSAPTKSPLTTPPSVQSPNKGAGADPYRQNESKSESREESREEKDLPHSKKVRGTLAHESGPKVNKSMLGDPVSLKAETSESRIDKGAEEGEG
ncbi:hypothetical protein K458DRAFT_264658, partial [Lentithecium fluviatile CBS 122367]